MRAGHGLVIASLAVAAGDWVAVHRRARAVEYVLKPLTLAVLIVAAVALRGDEHDARWALTLAALVLSLAGDVFLMVPRDLFVAGLAAFLLAHVAYVAAFNPTVPPALPTIPAAAGVAAVAGAIFVRLRAGMVHRGEAAMTVPVAVYVLALGLMVTSAIATAGRPEWTAGRSGLAIAGAVLFGTSDALIGWGRFVAESRWTPVAIAGTYHLAQALLVLALVG